MENEIERVRGGSRRSESDPAKSSHPFKGSNHCLTSFDVVLARFRVLMYMIKYAAVIGSEARTFVKFLHTFPISRFMEIVQANHRRALYHVHQMTKFCKLQAGMKRISFFSRTFAYLCREKHIRTHRPSPYVGPSVAVRE
jgi:hypothetical protein